ncbi:signal peptidase II [Mycoplasma procyoni]|uniref:signal peptidase II n=1 Tax=Mycoplasma procyoni TaxID=568784 RepID=UPI00197C64F6|nr:signal peptidase II [Mycoplasma procyoni]MBN3534932.1 signal peptidase II [Mycoplasma procyoni]
MQAIKKSFQKWLIYIKEFDKKRLLFNGIITFSILLALILVDQLTKNLIFEHKEFVERPNWVEGKNLFDYKVIGFRPILHVGVTSKLHEKLGFITIHILSVVVFLVALHFMIFAKKYYYIVVLGFLAAGDFGNMLDRFIYANGVKDILFIPWRDNGTFNFADLFIGAGAIGVAITIIIEALIMPYFKKSKKQDSQPQSAENTENTENSQKQD